jgi:hypothetical protein
MIPEVCVKTKIEAHVETPFPSKHPPALEGATVGLESHDVPNGRMLRKE